MKTLMNAIMKQEFKKALELVEEEEEMDPNTLVPVEMFEDPRKRTTANAEASGWMASKQQ